MENIFSCCKIRNNEMGRLFCFPHAGAGATVYAPWGREVPAAISLYPVLYPGREQRRNDAIPETLKQLAESIADEGKDVFAEKPFVMCGHCEGGIIAYETAVILEEKYGIVPKQLIVTGANPPSVPTGKVIGESVSLHEAANIFAERGFIDKKFANNKMYAECFVPILIKDFLLLQNYLDSGYRKVSCPILLMYGSDDPNIDRESINLWDKYSSAGFEAKAIEGGHFFINADNISEIMKIICDKIQ